MVLEFIQNQFARIFDSDGTSSCHTGISIKEVFLIDSCSGSVHYTVAQGITQSPTDVLHGYLAIDMVTT